MEGADIANIANDIWTAPFCLIVNNISGSEDPVECSYANQAFLACVDLEWAELIEKPGTELPESVASLFKLCSKDLMEKKNPSVIQEYSTKLKDFEIEDGILLELQSPTGDSSKMKLEQSCKSLF